MLRIPDFERVHLTLVGCGGTGSHIASGLVAVAGVLAERNIAVDMLFVDPDIVETKNVGRQLFGAGDVGQPKAEVLAARLNAAFALRIGASVRAIDALDTFVAADAALNLVIGAVDNPAARALLAKAVQRAKGSLWWLDTGNENHSGQVVLGNTADAKAMRHSVALGMIDRLPAPHILYPDLVRTPRKARATGTIPSCAELAAEGTQGLMVNRMVAAWACAMLQDFLVERHLRYFATAVDLQWGGLKSYVLDLPTLAAASGSKPDQLVVKRS